MTNRKRRILDQWIPFLAAMFMLGAGLLIQSCEVIGERVINEVIGPADTTVVIEECDNGGHLGLLKQIAELKTNVDDLEGIIDDLILDCDGDDG